MSPIVLGLERVREIAIGSCWRMYVCRKHGFMDVEKVEGKFGVKLRGEGKVYVVSRTWHKRTVCIWPDFTDPWFIYESAHLSLFLACSLVLQNNRTLLPRLKSLACLSPSPRGLHRDVALLAGAGKISFS